MVPTQPILRNHHHHELRLVFLKAHAPQIHRERKCPRRKVQKLGELLASTLFEKNKATYPQAPLGELLIQELSFLLSCVSFMICVYFLDISRIYSIVFWGGTFGVSFVPPPRQALAKRVGTWNLRRAMVRRSIFYSISSLGPFVYNSQRDLSTHSNKSVWAREQANATSCVSSVAVYV